VPPTGEPVSTSWERHRGAARAPLRYRRREPEKTLLHAVFREHLESFLAQTRERSSHARGLPAFVERDLRAYTDCGVLARGFARVRCPDCCFERLVAFSCKASICPSCATRRMEDGADHLVRNVFHVDTLTGLYQRMHGLSFGPPDPDLGQARVATRADGTLVGIRKPLAAHEPIMRAYLAVEDIQQAVKKAEDSGATTAYPPTRQGQRGTFAIVIQGDVQHGLWQR